MRSDLRARDRATQNMRHHRAMWAAADRASQELAVYDLDRKRQRRRERWNRYRTQTSEWVAAIVNTLAVRLGRR